MQSNKLAILCVDDEELILKSLVLQIREAYGSKYLYETSTSGEEALEVIDELVDEGIMTVLVISDWLMPGMKGDEFLSIVNTKYPNVIKIMLSGHADPEAVKNAKENSNLFSFVRKPWSKDELCQIIDKALLGAGGENDNV